MEYKMGWDTKALMKLILTSSTTGSLRKCSELAERDPNNRLLAPNAAIRLPAEMIRDQALFTSGLVVERIGGPSVKPYQPEGLWLSCLSKCNPDYGLLCSRSGANVPKKPIHLLEEIRATPTMATFDAPSENVRAGPLPIRPCRL